MDLDDLLGQLEYLLPAAEQSVVADIEEEIWAWREGDEGVSITDFDSLWRRLTQLGRLAEPGGARVANEAIAALAQELDVANSVEVDDVEISRGTLFRRTLTRSGLHLGGRILCELLTDELWNELVSEEFSQVGGLQEVESFSDRVAAIRDQALAELPATASRATQRSLCAIGACCALVLSDYDLMIAMSSRFLEMEAAARRESGDVASLQELLWVTQAGVAGRALHADGEGVDEFMRRIRIVAEPAGESLPLDLLRVWNDALQGLDPDAARAQAMRMLSDLSASNSDDSSDVLEAALRLADATLAIGDIETTEKLVNYWMPRALEADHSEGAKAWWERLKEFGASGESE